MSNYTREIVPTKSVQANGIRYAYRRFGKVGTSPLLFLEYINRKVAMAYRTLNQEGDDMPETTQEKNKALALEAFDALFNQRDYVAAEKFWSPHYIQHSAHIAPGREGLFNLVKSLPPTLKYESGTIVADGDFVIVHGRFSGFGQPVNWIAADILRLEGGVLVEHWDVIQDEATEEQSKSKAPMFGSTFPTTETDEGTISS